MDALYSPKVSLALSQSDSPESLQRALYDIVSAWRAVSGLRLLDSPGALEELGLSEEVLAAKTEAWRAPDGSLIGPMRSRGAVIGVVVAAFADGDEITANEVAGFSALCLQAGLAYATLSTAQRAEEMAALARIDALTNLPNRRAFEERYNAEWARAMRWNTPMAVISVDVDYFGAYNECYGHPEGDQCLRTIARALAAALRRPEDFLARAGGEEFVALLPGCEEIDATAIGERMAQNIRDCALPHAGTTLNMVTASFGVAVSHESQTESGMLIARADQALYQAKLHGRNRLCADAYVSKTPPNRRAHAAQHNLPNFITSFIGRKDQMLTISQALERHRIVSLTGPGGIGKTRLACEVARAAAREYSDGVLYVDCSVADTNTPVATLLARSAGMREKAAESAVDAIVAHHVGLNRLLVFDNAETAISETADIVANLVQQCPGIRVLATSREFLSIVGERVVPVEPLTTAEAYALFLDRAALSHKDGFDDASELELQQLCERLDRLPFAIELAASQSFSSVRAFISQTGPQKDHWRARSAISRQQSISDLIEWSYLRLQPQEQRAFRMFSVFAGTFDLSAACAVCDEPETITTSLLALLTSKSLIALENAGRWRMLELTSEYGRSQLQDAGDFEVARGRHAAYFSAVAHSIDRALFDGPDIATATELGAAAGANLALALDFLLSKAETANAGARLASDLSLYWDVKGASKEGRFWLEAALQYEALLEPHTLARTHYGIAVLASAQSDTNALIYHGERALDIHLDLGDEMAGAHARRLISTGKLLHGDGAEAKLLLEQSMKTFEQHGYERGVIAALTNLGVIAMDWEKDYAAAEDYFTRCLARYEVSNATFMRGITFLNLAEVAHYRADYATVEQTARQAIAIFAALNHPYEAIGQALLGLALSQADHLESARTAFEAAYHLFKEFDNASHYVALVWYTALWLLRSNRPQDAARVVGFAKAVQQREGVVPSASSKAFNQSICKALAGHLGEAHFSELCTAGEGDEMTPEAILRRVTAA